MGKLKKKNNPIGKIKMDWVDELLLRVEKINLEYEWNKIYE